MSLHTAEPWSLDVRQNISSDGEWRQSESGCYVDIKGDGWHGLASVVVRMEDDDDDSPIGFANAARIVACVNACAGISNEMLADDCFNKMRDDRDGLLIANASLREQLSAYEVTAANLVTVRGQRDEFIEALAFYADPTRYEGPNQSVSRYPPDPYSHGPYRYDVTRDFGALARTALATCTDTLHIADLQDVLDESGYGSGVSMDRETALLVAERKRENAE